MIAVRFGSVPGRSFRMKVPELLDVVRVEGSIKSGRVESWKRAGFFVGHEGEYSFFVVEPAEEDGVVRCGPLEARGRFRIVERYRKRGESHAAWAAFVPE
jgi:hypothetical protein